MIRTNTSLYPYQQEAFDKLRRLKIGALYMEMGTGKTRVTVELIKYRLERGKITKALWLCPCSVKDNLRADLIYHCGEVPPEIRIEGIESISGSDRLYLSLLEYISDGACMLIVDESNLVKNHRAKRTERITDIAGRLTYKLILNGTPVSRNEADLFAQWYLLDPEILGYKSYYSFAANHLEFYTYKDEHGVKRVNRNRIVRVLNVDYLTAKIALYSYQIKKSETGIKLPDKVYHTYDFSLTCEQYENYYYTRDYWLGAFVDEGDDTAIYKMFTALSHVTSGRRITTEFDEKMETEDVFADIEDNPRICTLRGILDRIGKEQCIIFCRYQKEVEEIMELIRRRGQESAEFTGQLNVKKREESLARFRNGTQFLVANKACGAYGLNLQFCHNIIFYDNDFNYATRAQAEDRIHRLGQEHTCHIYDICADNTFDGFVLDNLNKKVNLVEAFKKWLKKFRKKKEITPDMIQSDTDVKKAS